MNKLYLCIGLILVLLMFAFILSIPPAKDIRTIRAETIGGEFHCIGVNGTEIECPLNISALNNPLN